ncbi:bifunctional 4-hydroxy-2-oxoglutarate aldolase/2-dehydro-3-deoxy-phosphogluconate aldolase [Mucilaginibacter arboris]|uniref:Bifunctional 4-hydroxy-2-oxoglutarate aldolase/2-dehydro-3-deoxy-phosphogluconate aldolase n=1 Tax=Mucilaginibacter arboris TaxID=2682090 RepID=A0A7K1SS02_9SPHI|nr:bifunctional 4-hydroxy-2-oxoglutarate aldolase/2-dehydro-3-deoxy-phosphogluconate aldolase [Mucilaginibacter arboris]MVN20071.1 bifunctional 4-hydroxy-2-oxoglutarate aldolase/2-dehydro-3-deoxy-phosphogluconate aldolase [Mucilaginibacter arboris]
MNSKKEHSLNQILEQGTLPLFFYRDPEVSLEITRTIYKAGVRVFEYTNRGPEALENFKLLRELANEEMPDLELGIGTIKSVKEAEDFLKAGADFLVSPIVNPKVGQMALEAELLWIPGCMTPTEIFLAQENSAALIKLFPANILGEAFLTSIKELFPGQLFIPTGGVDLTKENISGWFKAGVSAVGLGSKLISKKVMEGKLYDELFTATKEAHELVKSCR